MPTPSVAKNLVKRALLEILDEYPDPQVISALWEHFGSACAYCPTRLSPRDRVATRDHLIPPGQQGSNHPTNLVLACGPCNDDRRDRPWETYLRQKCSTESEYDRRRLAILAWVDQDGGPVFQTSPALHELAQPHIDAALVAIDEAVRSLRAIRDGDA